MSAASKFAPGKSIEDLETSEKAVLAAFGLQVDKKYHRESYGTPVLYGENLEEEFGECFEEAKNAASRISTKVELGNGDVRYTLPINYEDLAEAAAAEIEGRESPSDLLEP